MLKKNGSILSISLLALCTFPALFAFRRLDDNRLTSWQWVFGGTNSATVFLILVGAVMLAVLVSRVSFPLGSPPALLFLSSFCVAALFWREPEVIVDASRYFTQAKHLEVYGVGYFLREWGRGIFAWTDLPLVPFLYGLVFRFFGESRLLIQIFTTFLFSMTVVLTYLTGKELWGEETGILGGSLLLGMPYLLTQVPLILVDVPTMFFLMLAVYAFLRALERGGLMIVVASLSLFLALLSKYSTWPMLSVLVIIGIVFLVEDSRHDRSSGARRAGRRQYIERTAAVIAITLVMAAAVVLFKHREFAEQIGLLMSFQGPGLRKWGETFTSTFLFQIHPFISAAALFSFFAAVRKRDFKYAIVCWLFVLLVLFQVKRIRYSIPLFPMIALMASYGLQYITDKEVRRFVVLCAVMSSLIVAYFGYLPFLEKVSMVNLETAGKFLNGGSCKSVEVFVLPQKAAGLNPSIAVPLLDLFTAKQIIYRHEAPASALGKEEETSPLRFTWEYRNPPYYRDEGGRSEGVPVVVISAEPGEALPATVKQRLNGYRLAREFDVNEGIFAFRTVVSVYRTAAGASSQ
ncbi:MAG: glycosyltransferase family 39 protein [Nitrospirae bacterium]|nr:glycosyltransferase family 39 protein [Nitrospirota bacterium]